MPRVVNVTTFTCVKGPKIDLFVETSSPGKLSTGNGHTVIFDGTSQTVENPGSCEEPMLHITGGSYVIMYDLLHFYPIPTYIAYVEGGRDQLEEALKSLGLTPEILD